MSVGVHIWRMFEAPLKLEAGSSSARTQLSGLIGGFGHVGVRVEFDYLSFWPGDEPGEHAAFAYSYDEDLARCGREPDTVIEIHGLVTEAMLDAWEKESAKPFHPVTHNCCTISARVLVAGLEAQADESFVQGVKMLARFYRRPVRSLRVFYSHLLRETQGIHDPSQLERLALVVRDVASA